MSFRDDQSVPDGILACTIKLVLRVFSEICLVLTWQDGMHFFLLAPEPLWCRDLGDIVLSPSAA